jgi:predicted ArsR family transcriptional regulator
VSAQVGLHITTVRFHLEHLERSGLIRRSVERAGARGRPRVLFVAAPPARAEGAQRDLTDALASALAADPDGGRSRAIRAGEAWSEHFGVELAAAASTEAGAAPLLDLLDRLGFDPELMPGGQSPTDRPGRTIELHACPFRDEARRNPQVVCSVHLGLLRGAARTLGHEAGDTDLRPFVRPELCIVDLRGDWDQSAAPETSASRA